MNNILKEVLAIIFVVTGTVLATYFFVDLELLTNINNLVSVFEGLGWFIAIFCITTLFTAYLVIIAKAKFMLRFLAIPLWLVFTISILVTIDQFLGYAYPIVPPSAQVIMYRVYLNKETKVKMIEAWMYLTEDERSRLYRFDHTDKKEQALEKGRRASQAGRVMEVKLRGEAKLGEDNERKINEDMIKHDIPHTGLPLKEYETNSPEFNINDLKEKDDAKYEMESIFNDSITIQMPDGSTIELPPGTAFTIGVDGEIEITN